MIWAGATIYIIGAVIAFVWLVDDGEDIIPAALLALAWPLLLLWFAIRALIGVIKLLFAKTQSRLD